MSAVFVPNILAMASKLITLYQLKNFVFTSTRILDTLETLEQILGFSDTYEVFIMSSMSDQNLTRSYISQKYQNDIGNS